MPVLKMKRGEKQALKMLSAGVAAHMTPLLEIVENKSGKTSEEHLETGFKDLAQGVQATARYLLEVREIAPAGPQAAVDAFTRAGQMGHPWTPVTGVTRTVDVAAALAAGGDGIAIRLTRDEFESGAIPTSLQAFMREHGLEAGRTDLLVDLGAVDDMVPAGIARLSTLFLGVIPSLPSWRTLSILACAFPLSLKSVGRNSQAFADRSEWLAWRDSLYANRGRLARLPTFGDCAIQHTRGVEGFDPRFMPMSAAIRYTLPEHWLLIKGESGDAVPLQAQFPNLAAKLASGPLVANFAGAKHCEGCRNVQAAASGAPRLGSPEAWRRLGTAHHLTVAVQQVRALTWP